MGPNDVGIVRVYTRRPGAPVADETFSAKEKFEVVVEAEAGQAILDSGAPYSICIVVRDLTTSTTEISYTCKDGDFRDPDPAWNKRDYVAVFGPYDPLNAGHIYEVLASVKARKVDPDVSFVNSPMFMYHAP